MAISYEVYGVEIYDYKGYRFAYTGNTFVIYNSAGNYFRDCSEYGVGASGCFWIIPGTVDPMDE